MKRIGRYNEDVPALEAEIKRLRALLKRCQFRIYGAGIGTDDLFLELYAITKER